MDLQRVRAFLQQGESVFRDVNNDFGAAPREVRAYLQGSGSDIGVMIDKSYYRPDGSYAGSAFASGKQAAVPDALKPYVQAMGAAIHPQIGGQEQ
jgi:hypothetical protein